MKIFRNRKTAKTNFTGRKTTKMRFFILASIVLVAISSTVAFSSITTAGSLGELLSGKVSLGNVLFNASVQNGSKKDDKSSRLLQLAPDSLVSELAAARSGHTATRLDGEKVLITGGDAGGTAEIFDAATGTSSATGSLSAARSGHTATKLADGRVLVLGGTSYGAAVASTEIFDAGTFSAGATMNAARSGHTATVLANGKILIAGGDLAGSAEIYNPADGTFTSISTMTTSRAGHSAALMKDGRILFVGGSEAQGGELNSAEIFDPATSTFSATGNEMAHHRTNALLRVLPDGKVQIIGGNNDLSMEVYDPAIDTIGAHAHLIPTGDEHDALLQSDLLSSPSRSAMFHNGQTDALFDRSNFTVTELGNQALVAGGANTSGTVLSSLTVLNSSSATVTTDKLDYQPGQTAVISGAGWQAGETVNIILHEDPHTHTERRLTTQADANGNFTANYLVENHDLNVTFVIGAKGASSGRTAQTTFTDGSVLLGNNGVMTATAVPCNQIDLSWTNANSSNTFADLYRNEGTTFNSSTAQIVAHFEGNNKFLNSGAVLYKDTYLIRAGRTYSYQIKVVKKNGQNDTNPTIETATANGVQMPTTNCLSTTTTTVTANPSTLNVNQSSPSTITLSAQVTKLAGTATGSPTGTVDFFVYGLNGSTLVNTNGVVVNASGIATTTISTNTVSGAAGNYQVRAYYSGDSNYTGSDGTTSIGVGLNSSTTALTSSKNPSTDGESVTFTATVASTSGTVTSGMVTFKDGAAVIGTGTVINSGTATFTISDLSVGTHSITAVYGGNTAYNSSTSGALSQVVNSACTAPNITTNPSNQIIIYGQNVSFTSAASGTSPSVKWQQNTGGGFTDISGATNSTLNITSPLVSQSGTQYRAVFTNSCGTANSNAATLTVNQKTVAGSFTAANKAYDGNTNAVIVTRTITLADIVGSDVVTLTGGSATFDNKNVGTGKTVTGTGFTLGGTNAGNYVLGTVATASANITLATLTVKAEDKSREYGGSNPTATVLFTGFVNDEILATSGVTGSPSCSTTATATSSVSGGPYPISCSIGTLAASNYTFNFVNGNLTISVRAVTITTDAKSKEYGAVDPALTYQVTSGSLVMGDSFTGSLTRDAGENVGTAYAINQGNVALNSNYNLSFIGANLTVTARGITITADAKSKEYGAAADPALTYQVTSGSLVTGDSFSGSLTRAAGNDVGAYAINQGSVALSNNYALTFIGANLTVTARAITVTVNSGQGKTYGAVDPILNVTVTGSLVTGDSFSGSIERASGESVGTYAITKGNLALSSNYALTFQGADFTISARAITITADAKSKEYGAAADPALTYQITGGMLVTGDSFGGNLVRDAGENFGTYAIKQGSVALSSNYTLSYVGANLTISKRAITVTADAQTKVYGANDPALTYQVTNGELAMGDSFGGSLIRDAGSNVGSYAIKQGTLALSGNYSLTFVGADLTITKKGLTITASSPAGIAYGSSIPTVTASYNGFITGDTVANSLSTQPTCGTNYTVNSAVGGYTTSCSNAVSANYEISYVGGSFNVIKANQTITFNSPGSQYIGIGGIALTATGGGSGNAVTFVSTTTSVCTVSGANVSFVGLGTCTITASQTGNDNYNAASSVSRSFMVLADATTVVLNTSGHTFIDFDCVTNVIAATVTDSITGLAIPNASVTFTIGTQSATATTNASGIASAAIVLNQPLGSVTVSASYAGSTNGFNLPGSASTTKTIGGSPNVGPGQDATSLYTGSLWFWTTSSTSSTATLTLSATIKDTFENCPGDITKAKVSFLISTNGGSSFSPVSSAQNLPVGLVNPNDPTTGTASAISQYNIGSSQSVTLTVRVVVGGQYNSSSSTYDVPVTIGKPGLANSLMGGGELKNNGQPFYANGFLGANSINSVFGTQVTYTKSGTNPKGDVTVTITSCNKPDGSVEAGCTISTPTKWHKYFIKSNSISELSLISGSASFGSKTNVSELLPDGSKVSLDGGNTMQLVFTPNTQPFPTGMSVTGGNCTNQSGCASIVIYKSNGLGGGVWYSSAWGQSGTSAPRTYLKNVFPGGNVVVQ